MALLRIEVVYAHPQAADAVTVSLPHSATARDAVEASGIAARHAEIDLSRAKLGIHGKVVAPGARLHEGDRVEIYRELAADPKEARRRRARKKR